MEGLRFVDQLDIAYSYLLDEMGQAGPATDPREMRNAIRTWVATGTVPDPPEDPTPDAPARTRGATETLPDGRQVIRIEGSSKPRTEAIGHGIKVSKEAMEAFKAMGGDMSLKMPSGAKLAAPAPMKQRKAKKPRSEMGKPQSPPA